jgi:hypothetical protein
MGRARELWEELGAVMQQQDVDRIIDLYAPDAVWLETNERGVVPAGTEIAIRSSQEIDSDKEVINRSFPGTMMQRTVCSAISRSRNGFRPIIRCGVLITSC